MAITLRNTKGVPLTHEELDGNFIELDTRVLSLEGLANSDNQTLSFAGATLTISGGNSVDLSSLLDNTDAQTLTFAGTTLSISGGNSVDLSSLFTDTNTFVSSASFDDATGTLTLTKNDATTVTVSLDGRYITSETDSQTLSLVGTDLSISNGNTVDLSGFLSAEADTLASVTARGASTTDTVIFTNGLEVGNAGQLAFETDQDPVTWNNGDISVLGYSYLLNFPTNQPDKTAPLLIGWNDLPYIQPYLPTDIGAQEANFGAFSRSLLLNGGDATETRLPGSVYIDPGRNFSSGAYGNIFIGQNGSGNIYIGQDANLNNSHDGEIYIGGTASTTTITGTTTLQGDGFVSINNDAYGNDVYAGFTTDKQIFNIQAASGVGGGDNGGSIVLSGGNAQNSGNNGGVLIATGAGGAAGTATIDIRADGDVAIYSQNGAITFDGDITGIDTTDGTATGSLLIRGGNNTGGDLFNAADGGDVTIQGGSSGFNPGGTVTINGGNGSIDGNIDIGTVNTNIISVGHASSATNFTGNVDFTNASVNGTPFLTSETVTSISLAANTLSYTDETGSTTNLDLSLYLDDTNLARITSGTVDGTGIATFNRDDATSFTVDFSALFDDTNLTRITSGSYNPSTSLLTLNRDSDGTSFDVDLSGLSGLTLSDVTGNDATTTDTVTFVNGQATGNITGYGSNFIIAPKIGGTVLLGKENTGGFSYDDTTDSLGIASTGTITIQGVAGSPVDIGTGTSGQVSIGNGTNTVDFASGSTVDFTGASVTGLTSVTEFTTSGNASIGGTLNVTGNTALSSDLNVGGNATITGNSTTIGNESIVGTLDVSGVATLSNNLNVSGDSSVTGNSSLTGNLTVGGNTTLSGDLTVNAGGTLDVNGVIITGINFTDIENTPSTIDGYGITNAVPITKSGNVSTDTVVRYKGFDFKYDDATGIPQIKLTPLGQPGHIVGLANVSFSSYVILGNVSYAKSSGLSPLTLNDTNWVDLTSQPIGNSGEHAQIMVNSTQQGEIYRVTVVATTPGASGHIVIEDLTN